jgi:hypothetical protein
MRALRREGERRRLLPCHAMPACSRPPLSRGLLRSPAVLCCLRPPSRPRPRPPPLPARSMPACLRACARACVRVCVCVRASVGCVHPHGRLSGVVPPGRASGVPGGEAQEPEQGGDARRQRHAERSRQVGRCARPRARAFRLGRGERRSRLVERALLLCARRARLPLLEPAGPGPPCVALRCGVALRCVALRCAALLSYGLANALCCVVWCGVVRRTARALFVHQARGVALASCALARTHSLTREGCVRPRCTRHVSLCPRLPVSELPVSPPLCVRASPLCARVVSVSELPVRARAPLVA